MADDSLRAWGAAGVRMSLFASLETTVSWNPAAGSYYQPEVLSTLKAPRFTPNYDELTDDQLAQAEDECAQHIRSSKVLYTSEEL